MTPSEVSASLVARVQREILETFDVSEQEAYQRAYELVALAEGWGTPESVPSLDWSYRVRKDLGMELKWRSENDRAGFERLRKLRTDAYEVYIERRESPPGPRI
jgi:hypothetical protein